MRFHNYFTDLAVYAEKLSPNEATGFLHRTGEGSLRFEPVRNQASLEEFIVSPKDALTNIQNGAFAFFHSHCQSDSTFSDLDLSGIENTSIPWLLYSTKDHHFNFRRPKGMFPPFEHREFIVGVQDCVTLAGDYYEKFFGLRFPFFARPPSSIEMGFALDQSVLFNMGFERIDGPARTHDLVLMSNPFKRVVNHVGVVLKDDLLLHQQFGNVSGITQYTDTLKACTRFVFRHPKFTSKLSML